MWTARVLFYGPEYGFYSLHRVSRMVFRDSPPLIGSHPYGNRWKHQWHDLRIVRCPRSESIETSGAAAWLLLTQPHSALSRKASQQLELPHTVYQALAGQDPERVITLCDGPAVGSSLATIYGLSGVTSRDCIIVARPLETGAQRPP